MLRDAAIFAATLSALVGAAAADECGLSGTYRLVADQRTVVETGEVVKVEKPQGYISYGEDRRMLVVIIREPRPKPRSVEGITDEERIVLFNTVTAYSGTFTCDASTVTHRIDLSWNSTWTGTTQV